MVLRALMITAYDWMNPAREQNNFRKDSGKFSRHEEMTRSLFSSKHLRAKDLLMGKTLMIWTSTEYFD